MLSKGAKRGYIEGGSGGPGHAVAAEWKLATSIHVFRILEINSILRSPGQNVVRGRLNYTVVVVIKALHSRKLSRVQLVTLNKRHDPISHRILEFQIDYSSSNTCLGSANQKLAVVRRGRQS